MRFLFISLLFCVGVGMFGCSEPPPEPETVRVSDEEAQAFAEQARDEISGTFADELDVQLWASDTLIGDPIALDVDHRGRAFITVTNRRYTSSLDLRDHPEWVGASMQMTEVDDRRAFLRRELAPERSETNSSWLTDYNDDGVHDWRDLTVEQEEIYRIEDLSGTGQANQSTLLYQGFNDEVSDLAGAILYHDGALFVGVAPELRRFHTTDEDRIGDAGEAISQGYGVHITMSGHGMSGLTVGPDGRLYWSIGDIGSNVVDGEGRRWAHPHQGAIFRSEPDGSNFEVFAAGLRNTHEFTFDKYGNLITVDNDGDHAGEFERVVYLVDGSDSGWRYNWQFGKYTDPANNDYNVWMDEDYFRPRFDDQAAHVLPPLARYDGGPAGMVYNPGTALGEQWQDHFFVANFVGSPSGSGIDAFTLEPSGASFELARDVEVMRGIQVTGMDVGPDGALYLADWVEGWDTNEEGRIWKLDTSDAADSAAREQTRELLAASFDEKLGEELVDLMGHPDMRVRMKAQFELAAREEDDLLLDALSSDKQLRRIHGIWGIGQLGRQEADRMQPLMDWVDDDDPEVRAQVTRMLGDVRYEPAAEALIPLLADEQPRVRFFAAEALGRIEYEPAVEPIVDMLEANDDEDVYLRQGGAIALARIGDEDALVDLADHPSRAVRIAAVIALKRLEHPGVARFLDDEDEFVVTNAARAINDDAFIDEAVPALAEMLAQDQFVDNEPLMRRAINAALYSGRPTDADRLARFAGQQNVAEELRAEALATLAGWSGSSELDRVTGRYRGMVENDEEAAREAIAPVIAGLLRGGSPVIREAAVEAVNGVAYREALPELVRLLADDEAASVRVAALTALRDLDYSSLDEAYAIALDDEEGAVRRAALEMLPALDLPDEDRVALLSSVLENGSVDEQQTAFDILGRVEHPAAIDLLVEYMDRLIAGDVPRAIELDVLEAAQRADAEQLTRRLEQYQAQKPADDSVATYREALYGGNAEQGRDLFHQQASAQCIRCHVVDEEGSSVGPELTKVGARMSREQLLEAMVDPTARLAPGFGGVTVTLEDGQTLRGVLEDETSTSITIRSGSEQGQTVQKDDIVERINTSSPMPAMGEILTRRELRDLVEYLTTLTGE